MHSAGDLRSLVVVDGSSKAGRGLPLLLGEVDSFEAAVRFVSVRHLKPEEWEVFGDDRVKIFLEAFHMLSFSCSAKAAARGWKYPFGRSGRPRPSAMRALGTVGNLQF